jgi:serine/threonine protein kinase
VALKILAPAFARDSDFRQRFIMEARAAAAVDDPHIIPIFEAGSAGDELFIAMRYVAGGDVRTLLDREGPMSPERAVAGIIAPVALALDAAHAAGLVHRDVKPANMLVDVRPDRLDHVYLSDFGLTRAAQASTSLTDSGKFVGTLDYVAPEQIQGAEVDGRTDQYALACSAFAMLTGAPPFVGDTPVAVIYAHISERPPPLTSRRPGTPPEADQVMAKALAKTPAGRYANCREFADALMAAFGLATEADRRRGWAAPAALPRIPGAGTVRGSRDERSADPDASTTPATATISRRVLMARDIRPDFAVRDADRDPRTAAGRRAEIPSIMGPPWSAGRAAHRPSRAGRHLARPRRTAAPRGAAIRSREPLHVGDVPRTVTSPDARRTA